MSGKMKLATMAFVVAFDMQKPKKSPARGGARELFPFSKLLFLFLLLTLFFFSVHSVNNFTFVLDSIQYQTANQSDNVN